VESALAEHAAVLESAVIGVPSERWGETPYGFVRLMAGVAESDVEDILGTVNARLGKTQRLAALEAIEEMPRSHIGKLLKTELRERIVQRGDRF
jgi:acyl-coenzyme A synthetase/AMP-(fatty) acid ligase